MVPPAGLTPTTHQLAIASLAETPAELIPVADAVAVTLVSRSRGVATLGPESTKVSLSSKSTHTMSPTLPAPKSATAWLTVRVAVAPLVKARETVRAGVDRGDACVGGMSRDRLDADGYLLGECAACCGQA